MAIVKPKEMNFSDKNIIILVSGLPGVGKSTLSCSAPDVLVIDTDEGMSRVSPEHRKDASICKKYEEILVDLKEAEGVYKTVVIDTCGALIESMKDWAIRTDPSARKRNGGISQTGFGVVKTEFLRLSADLRKKFNVVFVFHETKTKDEETVWYELMCEGSARTLVWQPCDLGAHMYIEDGARMLGFSPTANYNAKSAYGIKGVVRVPELKPGEPNLFLSKLFDSIKATMRAETEALNEETKKYEDTMKHGRELISVIQSAKDIPQALEYIDKMPHALTSEKELKNELKKKMNELGITYDKETKTYVDSAKE